MLVADCPISAHRVQAFTLYDEGTWNGVTANSANNGINLSESS